VPRPRRREGHNVTEALIPRFGTVRSSPVVFEGHVNRIKMIKRQMYGRAKLDLLRKRVLLAT
jgi:transposase